MIPHKPHQLDEGLWGQQYRARGLSRARRRVKGHGKVRPVPGYGEQEAILTAQNHPGFGFAPEDAYDAPLLSVGGTLFGHDRGPRSLKCNIRCGLFGG